MCYACWLAARRNVRVQQDQQSTSTVTQDAVSQHINIMENQPSTSNEVSNVCVWCHVSIHGRHSHSLPQGPERDVIATRILPRQVRRYFHKYFL